MATSGQKSLSNLADKLDLTSLSPGRKYLIGVSGGCDSMALLHLLHERGFRHLIVCHLNHGLRGREAAGDAALVRRTARKMGLTFEESRTNCAARAKQERKSLELAAREARREFFTQRARKYRCRSLLLAHHADDQVETVLFNFLRGTGAAGLGGMTAESRAYGLKICRPLLGVKRSAILEYVKAAGVPYREDASNTDPKHTRNRLRHEVIPVLTAVMGETCKDAILRAADILRAEDAWMSEAVPTIGSALSCRLLKELPLALQRRTVLRWLTEQKVPEPGFAETRLILSLLNDGSGPAKVNLPGDWHARRRAGQIFLERVRK